MPCEAHRTFALAWTSAKEEENEEENGKRNKKRENWIAAKSSKRTNFLLLDLFTTD